MSMMIQDKIWDGIPNDFNLNEFADIEPYLSYFSKLEFNSVSDLETGIEQISDIESFLSENLAWRYINYTRYTDKEEFSKLYLDFVNNIQPELTRLENKIAVHFTNAKSFEELKNEFLLYGKKLKLGVELFREANVELDTKQSILSKKYSGIQGQMSIEHDGQELTLQQAAKMLKSADRSLRESIYKKINDRRLINKTELDELFSNLIALRVQEAKNCGYTNYRDYKHDALGRFDYRVEDVLKFHESIGSEVVPIQAKLDVERKLTLKIDKLKPYDLNVNLYGDKPLEPFTTGDELVNSAIKCFNRLDPFFGDCLIGMRERGLLDLESRAGKAPGGYNYPLDRTGFPFIFMNASGSMRDVTTMVHEGGHAVHSVLCKDLKINTLKHCPSEVAELASMSMELISMDTWDEFFDEPKELLRAKIEQLDGVLGVLPWIATVDKFQHWIYTNPNHTAEERDKAWVKIYGEFTSEILDYEGLEKYRENMWQKQLHIFEVPFYYIEYGIAQLGAIAIWRNYCNNPKEALMQYKEALKLGYTKSVPEIYETAGIKFDFSAKYVSELMLFVWDKYYELVAEFQKIK